MTECKLCTRELAVVLPGEMCRQAECPQPAMRLCRYCSSAEKYHEYTGLFKGVHCFLLDDCSIYKWAVTGTEAPQKRAGICLATPEGCYRYPDLCKLKCQELTSKASAWDECLHCPHIVALHLGPAINWTRKCLVPGCPCPGFPIKELPDEMWGNPKEAEHWRTEPSKMYMSWADDPVNHPSHYTSHPSGVECIAITEHMNFCLGNAIKYLWRAGLKQGTSSIEDLEKAAWYIQREINRLRSMSDKSS